MKEEPEAATADRFHERDRFIPFSRKDLIRRCLEEGRLNEEEQAKFREFCEILTAYYHFQFHEQSESLKEAFAPFNPDADVALAETTQAERDEKEKEVLEIFQDLADRANYYPISEEKVREAFEKETMIKLRTDVDFEEFDRFACYYRGDIDEETTVKKWGFLKKTIKVDVLQRVLILIKFQDEEFFRERFLKKKPKGKFNPESLEFQPGKYYLYLYKNIPKFDLELVFPNVKLSMTWKDRLLFFVPAIGAAIPVLIKALPQILLLVFVICVLVMEESKVREMLDIGEQDVTDNLKVLTAVMAVGVALGGLAFKQWSNFKNKKIQFQKLVTETLFFRNLASGLSAFNRLVDSVEEEVCKEIILVYYHLLVSKDRHFTVDELDAEIEQWMEKKFGRVVDFDVEAVVGNLKEIKGPVPEAAEEVVPEVAMRECSLLELDGEGRCHLLDLSRSTYLLDHLWDRFFDHANASQ
ncbi:MAG: TMEM143 family protein [Verrucomicrobiota bacterium]